MATKSAQQRGRSSRTKGKVGEREVRDVFRARGIPADVVSQLQAGQIEGEPDVRIGVSGYYVEVKRVERLRIPEWLAKVDQDAPGGSVPIIAFRRSREPWRAIIPLADLAELIAEAEGLG